ncbi:hypothetical protein ACFQU1_13425 [Chelatococcus sp. GCM10030263]|uniref:hypothetical protein n=1 Tax=Chelatococcus sp. GCM10030263 TaxID=3273387 RepID=UPI0036147B8C
MRVLKSISSEHFAELRKMLSAERSRWRAVLYRAKATRVASQLEDEHLAELLDLDLWGCGPQLLLTKGTPSEPVDFEAYLKTNDTDMFLFRYNDDGMVIVVNPDQHIAARFPLEDASWYFQDKPGLFTRLAGIRSALLRLFRRRRA